MQDRLKNLNQALGASDFIGGVAVDATPPTVSSTISDLGIAVTTGEAGTIKIGGTAVASPSITTTATVGEQTSVLTGALTVTDSSGNAGTDTSLRTYKLGTATGETLSGQYVWGWGGNDTITGTTGNDSLYGGDNNDTITGGTGADIIYGGGGADIFGSSNNFGAQGQSVVATTWSAQNLNVGTTITYGNGVDIVADFVSGLDKLNVYTGNTAPTNISGLGYNSAQTNNTTYVMYGSFDTSTKVFTFAANWSATYNDALVYVGSGNNLQWNTGVIILTDITQALIASDFSGVLDTTGPTISAVTPSASTISLTSSEAGPAGLYDGSNNLIGSTTTLAANTAGTVAASAQSTLTQATLRAADVSGNSTSYSTPIYLGTTGADTITGTANAEIIYAFDGNNTITGGAGADIIYGGTGSDTFIFNAVARTSSDSNAYGSTSRDSILIDSTDYVKVIATNVNNFSLTAGAKPNLSTNDFVNVQSGFFWVELGNDGYTTSSTDAGDILFNYTGTLTTAQAQAMTIVDLTGTSGADTFTGGVNNDTLNGAAGDDVLNGAGGNDTISGGAGNDTITYDAADASVDGGADTDTLTAASAGAGVTITLSANGITNIENIIGSTYADTLTGDSGNNALTGGAGNDSLTGGSGVDTFNVNSGTDSITDLGAGGADVVVVSSGATLNAMVTAAWTATNATSNAGTASINANGYSVNVIAATGANGWTITNSGNSTGVSLTGSVNADTITGGTGADTIDGSGGADTFDIGAADAVTDIVKYTVSDVSGWQTASNSAAFGSNTGYDIITNLDAAKDYIKLDGLTFTGSRSAGTIQSVAYTANAAINAGTGVLKVTDSGTDGTAANIATNIGTAFNVSSLADGEEVIFAVRSGASAPGGAGKYWYGIYHNTGSDDVIATADIQVLGYANDVAFIDPATVPTVTTSYSASGISVTSSLIGTIKLGSTALSTSITTANQAVTVGETTTAASGTLTVTTSGGVTGADTSGLIYGVGSSSGDTLTGQAVWGWGGADTITGTANADTTYGGDGNDTLVAADNDYIDGGADIDTARFAAAVSASNLTDARLVNVEYVVITNTGNATYDFTAQSEALNITGNSGSDTIKAGSGNDTITGGAGVDTIDLGTGAVNTLVFNAVVATSSDSNQTGTRDIVTNLQTTDFIKVAATNVSNFNVGTNVAFDGNNDYWADLNNNSQGNDVGDVVFRSNLTGTSFVYSNSATYATARAMTIVDLTGTSGADTLTGGQNNDTLNGGDGNDVLNGAGGNDTISGGAGNDTITYDAVDASVDGGNDTDTLTAASAGTGVTITLSTNGISNVENIIGSAYADTLTGDSSNNTLTGGAGNDTFNVDNGTDTISDLGNGADVVVVSSGATLAATAYAAWTATASTSNAGTASINASGKNIVLTAATGASGWTITNSSTAASLTGSANNDTIIGGTGNDTISGGAGNDALTGGSGVDTFNVNFGTDSITDLGNGADIVVVSAGATLNATATAAWTATSASTNGGTASITTSGFNINVSLVTSGNGWAISNSASSTGVTLTGSAYADTLTGGRGTDSISAGDGNDTIILGSGHDGVGESLDGGGGTADILRVTGGASLVNDTVSNMEQIIVDDSTSASIKLIFSEAQMKAFSTQTTVMSFQVGQNDYLTVDANSTEGEAGTSKLCVYSTKVNEVQNEAGKSLELYYVTGGAYMKSSAESSAAAVNASTKWYFNNTTDIFTYWGSDNASHDILLTGVNSLTTSGAQTSLYAA